VSYLVEVVPDIPNRAEVAGPALGEKDKLIEELERRCRRLMDACYDDKLSQFHQQGGPLPSLSFLFRHVFGPLLTLFLLASFLT